MQGFLVGNELDPAGRGAPTRGDSLWLLLVSGGRWDSEVTLGQWRAGGHWPALGKAWLSTCGLFSSLFELMAVL